MMIPFENLVTAHGARVLRVCRAVLGPGPDAEDAWSETFLAALQAWPTADQTTDAAGWLVTIAHRKALDIVRARARHAVPMAELPERGHTPAQRDLDLWAAVAALPEKQRHAVALHHLGGLAHAEVARLLGGTAEAARRACADGIRNLRRAMREEDDHA